MKTQKEIIPNIIINNTSDKPRWWFSVVVVLAGLLIVTNFDVLGSFIGSLSHVSHQDVNDAKVRVAELEKTVALLKDDRLVLEEASNAMLAIQEYYFENKVFPDSLDDLAQKKNLHFLTLQINDVKQVYYEKRATDFVLCVRLSDGVKGVNVKSCKIE